MLFPLTGENIQKVVESEQKSINEIKSILKNSKDDIAALIIEPIQGEGGDNHFRENF